MNLLVPSLFPYEVANALWAAVRWGRLEEGLAHEALRVLGWEVWEVEPAAVLELALSVGLPVYESAFSPWRSTLSYPFGPWMPPWPRQPGALGCPWPPRGSGPR
ncbi:type II toxin-antitoxin system VapC family toxin [Thermus sp.]|uniref:type II toxin-antitoxin system VapC family toxin n=1 Tax=Thermus sp. TaxID=275 RepID=UPI00307E165B